MIWLAVGAGLPDSPLNKNVFRGVEDAAPYRSRVFEKMDCANIRTAHFVRDQSFAGGYSLQSRR